ncbi:unnamed protein product [Meganyctiphanes norvegica]|uniref:bis(5'-adenosyl)-triphosphatase n=1 Tax=Meganyctiphanes norvegica TaxID=48144 RepID=A0AAV2SCX8_MEGNR
MAEPLSGPLMQRYCGLAASAGVWLSLGGLHVKEEGSSKISNSHVIVDDLGEIITSYVKAHLFSVNIPERNLRLEESEYVTAGNEIVPPFETPVGNVALGVCYDMRFAEFSIIQRRLGAHILTFPSAFTVTTGMAHWEALLRCRAIENQCYVIAAAQTGQHNKKRSSYGHAIIIDPWGAVVGQVSEGTNLAIAEVDISYLEKIRTEMAVMKHRCSHIYSLSHMSHSNKPHLCEIVALPSTYASLKFGQVSVPGNCIFLKSALSQAFVNKKPVVPGHSLITPERPVKRFSQLNSAEVSDVAQMTLIVHRILSEKYNAESCNIAIQDGPDAGQTIEHVHVHILPISANDVISELQGHENQSKSWRSNEDMAQEAEKIKSVALSVAQNLLNKARQLPISLKLEIPTISEGFFFGNSRVDDKLIITKSKNLCAFLAPNPILPGHTYISFQNPIEHFNDQTLAQLVELFQMVQIVQAQVEAHFNAQSSTIVFLSGFMEDSNIQSLHAQIIPRFSQDLPKNDDIYGEAENHRKNHIHSENITELISFVSDLRAKIYK